MHDTMPITATADLHVICGPRFNGFTSAGRTPDARPEFFRPDDWTVPSEEAEEYERWDGMA